MKVLFSLHAGEYVFRSKVEKEIPQARIWVPAKDTGIDFLLTDPSNKRTAAIQVKFSKDFLSDAWPKEYQESLVACGWWNLSPEKIKKSSADFWVLVLHSFFQKEFQYIIIKPKELYDRLRQLHGDQKIFKTYFWVTKDGKVWETRGLKKNETYEIIQGKLKNDSREFTVDLNNFEKIRNQLLAFDHIENSALLNSALKSFESFYEQNKTDSPLFSNVGWLVRIINDLLISQTEEELIHYLKEFQDYKPLFISSTLSSEDFDECSSEIVVKAQNEFRKLKQEINTIKFKKASNGAIGRKLGAPLLKQCPTEER